jgi:hypothetical protein
MMMMMKGTLMNGRRHSIPVTLDAVDDMVSVLFLYLFW